MKFMVDTLAYRTDPDTEKCIYKFTITRVIK